MKDRDFNFQVNKHRPGIDTILSEICAGLVEARRNPTTSISPKALDLMTAMGTVDQAAIAAGLRECNVRSVTLKFSPDGIQITAHRKIDRSLPINNRAAAELGRFNTNPTPDTGLPHRKFASEQQRKNALHG